MTNREFLNAILALDSASADVRAFAQDELAKMDARNAKRAAKPSKIALANEPLKLQITAFVVGHAGAIASEIAEGCGLTVAKVSALCRQLVDAGVLTVKDIKVKGKGTCKSYSANETNE